MELNVDDDDSNRTLRWTNVVDLCVTPYCIPIELVCSRCTRVIWTNHSVLECGILSEVATDVQQITLARSTIVCFTAPGRSSLLPAFIHPNDDQQIFWYNGPNLIVPSRDAI